MLHVFYVIQTLVSVSSFGYTYESLSISIPSPKTSAVYQYKLATLRRKETYCYEEG